MRFRGGAIPEQERAASSAALFHTCRFENPSSYSAMSAALGRTIRSRTSSAMAAFRRSFQQVGGDADLQQPDRLEVRAEEEARRAEDVVAIG